ncbi:MAG: O-antigen ligase family protein [Bacteroidia bacterium]
MRQTFHSRTHLVLLLLIAVTLPFSRNINSYCIVLLALNWVAEGQFREKWQRLRNNRLALLFLAFFLLHVAGVLYSEYWQDALKLVERKLALLVFPVVLGSIAPIGKKNIQKLFLAFAATIAGGALFSLLVHAWQWLSTGAEPEIFYHALVQPIGISAIYYSCYVCFSIFALAFYIKENWQVLSFNIKFISGFLILFLTGFLILLSSKIFLFIFIILGNLFLLFFIFNKQRIKKAAIAGGAFTILVAVVIASVDAIQERFRSVWPSNLEVLQQEQFRYDTPFTGLTLRLVLWQMAWQVQQEQQAWIQGVGIGDARPLLNEQYRERNLYLGNPDLNDTGYLNYNVHNQYVQVLLELGVVGLLLWLAYLFLPLLVAGYGANRLWIFFTIMMATFALTEVYLATQRGVVFFAMFQSLFVFLMKKDETGANGKFVL